MPSIGMLDLSLALHRTETVVIAIAAILIFSYRPYSKCWLLSSERQFEF